MDYKFFLLRFMIFDCALGLKNSLTTQTFPPIVKCAVFDELDVSNHIYIFCTCALPKKDSHMDDKIPLRHRCIIYHILAYVSFSDDMQEHVNTLMTPWIYY